MIKEFGYEYDAVLDNSLWKETRGKVTSEKLFGAYCLRSGRDAIKAIAREFKPSIVLLPALSCDSMVMPFKMYGHKVHYYRLNNDYSIDIKSIEKYIGSELVLFLYMDYFGIKSINDIELEQLKNSGNIIFIEDRTHNLIWDRKSKFHPNYTIASLRKWLPIPDGGLLWGEISKPFEADTSFSALRLEAQCMRHEYLNKGDEVLKTKYRRIFTTVSDIMDTDEPSSMTAYSYSLAKKSDFESTRTIRSQNADALIKILRASPHISLIQDKTTFSDLYVAFKTPKRDDVQKQLSENGIFNTIIWPLTDEQKHTCSVAKDTEENMLAAPCDQRYTVDDMIHIGKEIVKVINNVNK